MTASKRVHSILNTRSAVIRRVSYVNLLFGLILALNSSGLSQDIENFFDRTEFPWISEEASENREDERIETDRDSLTPATTTVAAGKTIFESSYSMIENRNAATTHSFPEILTRIGLTDRLEMRIGWNYEMGGGNSISNGDAGGEPETSGASQESQVLYGLKFELTKQRDWIPQSAGIIQATTPTSGPANYSDLQLGYVFGWTIFNDWQLDSSIRYIATKEEGDHFSQWSPSVVLKVPVAEQWNSHIEYFGIFTDGRSTNLNQQYISPGVHYLISRDVEVGIRLGWGLNQDAAAFFTNVGLGLRF